MPLGIFKSVLLEPEWRKQYASYITVQGALTDVAAALNRCPEIAGRMTVASADALMKFLEK